MDAFDAIPGQSKVRTVVVPPTALYFLALATFAARMVTRVRRRQIGIDDWLLTIAMILATGFYACVVIGVTRGGFGRHVIDLTEAELSTASLLSLVIEVMAIYSMTFVKLSVAFMLKRFNRDSKAWVWTLNGLIAINIAVVLVSNFWHFLQCVPLKALWDFTVTNGVCMTQEKLRIWIYTASGAFVVTDLIASLLPIVIIRQLRISLAEKIAIGALMSLGLVCTVAAAMKMVQLIHFSTLGLVDLTWGASDLIMWGIIEICIGIIAACLPVMKSVLERFLRAFGILPSSKTYWEPKIPEQYEKV